MKQFLRSFLTLLMLVVWASGFAQSSLSVDFESDLTTYTDWTCQHIARSATITPHSGTYYGNTSRKATAYVQTKNKIEAPQQLTFYISKETNNTTNSNWKIQVSTDGENWEEVKNVSATSVKKGQWKEVKQNLEQYKNNYVRIYYDGNTANRCIDDITLTVASAKTLTSLAISGEATKKAYNDGEEFDPTGLVVTGTYDDNTTATITNGITWTKTPATLTVGNTSCSVTATVNGITSPAYKVKGLTVTKTLTLSIDPATSTVVKAPVKVTLTANANADATIYYTTNGDTPSTSSTKYDAPFEVTKSGTTVKAIAVAEGAEKATAEATYTIKPDQPVFSDESKTFKDAFNVTLSLPESTDPTSTIHYAIGKDATAESPLYESPINISAEKDGAKVILHAVVVDQYGNVGMEKRCTYTKTTSFIFDFTGDWEGITPLKNNDDANAANVVAGKELKVGGIVMTATNGTSLTTCLYGTKNSHNLRVYTNGSITFTAPVGYNISEVTFNNNSAAFETTVGTYNKGTWTGNAHAVTFKATDLVKLNNATIKLVAAAATPLTLDEDADDTDTKIKANNGKTVDVKLTRSLKAGAWNTICLPFDVTTEQIKNILKAEGMVREYADDDATAQTITFKKVEGNMKAGEPYLIKPTEDITSLAFEGVTITAIEGNLQGKAYGICGTLGKYTMKTDGTELFLNAAGKFVAPAAATNTMKGFRAYFMVPSGSSAAAININIDGETTGINSIETNATVNGKVYNLNGQYVGNSLNGLKKGIYVVNGKKVIK